MFEQSNVSTFGEFLCNTFNLMIDSHVFNAKYFNVLLSFQNPCLVIVSFLYNDNRPLRFHTLERLSVNFQLFVMLRELLNQ